VSEVSFPGDGQDGEQPPPGGAARDETAGGPAPDGAASGAGHGRDGAPAPEETPGAAGAPVDDWDPDAEMASFIAAVEAGRVRVPEQWELECQGASISLGDATDVDLAELAAMLGPDGLGGEVFAQDRPAGVMRPGPVLAALTEAAATDPARLTDDQVLGAMSAARRLAARAEFLELEAVAEFTRRREAQFEAATAAKVPPGRREGEFADAELAMELVTSVRDAGTRMDLAVDLAARYPRTRDALAAGLIDGARAKIIWRYTRHLTDPDAATADQLLAELAPHLRYDQLGRKALATAIKLDPEAYQRAKDEARRDGARVEARLEDSGNASLAGRELATEDVMASKAHIDALAVAMRRGGLPGSLRQLRVLAFLDLTQGRNPLDRLAHPVGCAGQDCHPDAPRTGGSRGDAEPDAGNGPSGNGYRDGEDNHGHDRDGDQTVDQSDEDDEDEDEDEDDDDDGPGGGPGDGPGVPGSPGGTAGRVPAPLPALINLTIPAGTLLGWSDAPGDAGGWGLLDPAATRRLVQAASAHPRTRWCITVTGPDGTAVAHGCARGRHPWSPEPAGGNRDGPPTTATGGTSARGPDPGQAAALAELLRRLNVTLTPIAKGSCDHRTAEDRYAPSRALKHLVRARTATCPAPGCGAQAYYSDLDHTLAYPAGITDQCNLGPPCRRHHRVKQAPGWQLTQPEPGVMRWQTPSGRVYTTTPTVYEA